MRASGSLEGNSEGQRWRYGLAHAVGLGDADPLTADTDAVVERGARVEVIALGQLQVDENLASGTSLHLLRRYLHDGLVAKIGIAEASHSHRRCQATQGQGGDCASRQVGDANGVVVGVGNVQFASRNTQAAGFVKLRLLAIATPWLAAAQIGR